MIPNKFGYRQGVIEETFSVFDKTMSIMIKRFNLNPTEAHLALQMLVYKLQTHEVDSYFHSNLQEMIDKNKKDDKEPKGLYL